MGKYKFRFSDMIPNAWFHKLKYMGKGRDNINTTTTTNNNNNHHHNNKTNSPKKKQIKPSTTPPTTTANNTNNTYPRKSYYFTRELISNDDNTLLNLPDPPRKSSRERGRRRTSSRSSPRLVSSSISAGCSCRATVWANDTKSLDISPPNTNTYLLSTPEEGSTSLEETEPGQFPPEFRSDQALTTQSCDRMMSLTTSACPCKLEADNSTDIVIDVDKESLFKKPENGPNRFDNISELGLAPIITKQVNVTNHEEMKKQKKDISKQRIKGSMSKIGKEDPKKSKRHYQNSGSSPGIRLRVNSPRIASRRPQVFQGRRSLSSLSGSSCTTTTTTTTTTCSSSSSLSASLAIVKSSMDPQRDFKESMVEMIVENNIRGSKDLEDLLACYLSLNSDEYHHLIIKVFKQIWFDLDFVKFK